MANDSNNSRDDAIDLGVIRKHGVRWRVSKKRRRLTSFSSVKDFS